VRLYFANKDGDVFHLPFHVDGDFATPEPFVPIPPGASLDISGILANPAVDGTIESLTVTRNGVAKTYQYDELIGGKLSAFGGQVVSSPAGHIADIIMPPGSSSAPAPEERAELLSDALADTGFVNLTSWGVDFDEDVVNQDGPDIILLDWGSEDTVDITIRGVTLDDATPTSTSIFQGAFNGRVRFQSDQRDVDTLAELVAATFHRGPTTSASSTAYAIDLSDFGFDDGEALPAGSVVNFTDGQGIDPMAIYALPHRPDIVPEPASLAGAVLAVLILNIFRFHVCPRG
jgi:hypothetical protein